MSAYSGAALQRIILSVFSGAALQGISLCMRRLQENVPHAGICMEGTLGHLPMAAGVCRRGLWGQSGRRGALVLLACKTFKWLSPSDLCHQVSGRGGRGGIHAGGQRPCGPGTTQPCCRKLCVKGTHQRGEEDHCESGRRRLVQVWEKKIIGSLGVWASNNSQGKEENHCESGQATRAANDKTAS